MSLSRIQSAHRPRGCTPRSRGVFFLLKFSTLKIFDASSHALPRHGDGTLRSRQTRPDLSALSSAPGRVKPDLLGSLVVALFAVDAGALAVGGIPTVALMPVEFLHMCLLLLVRPHNRIV